MSNVACIRCPDAARCFVEGHCYMLEPASITPLPARVSIGWKAPPGGEDRYTFSVVPPKPHNVGYPRGLPVTMLEPVPSVVTPQGFGCVVTWTNQPAKIHRVKCWPEYFQAVIDGRKKFEARLDDRDYAEGDGVVLVEWNPHAFPEACETGRTHAAIIGYVLRGPSHGVEAGHCIFSLLKA